MTVLRIVVEIETDPTDYIDPPSNAVEYARGIVAHLDYVGDPVVVSAEWLP